MEKLLQYAWQYRLWENPRMTTVDNRPVEILNPGWLNEASGPDFFNSAIIIDDEKWVGNVEIHTRASDWFRHGHHTDTAYNSVILHVVGQSDTSVTTENGNTLPQMEFTPRTSLRNLYARVSQWHGGGLLCSRVIAQLPSLTITDLFDSLAFERLYAKAERFGSYLERTSRDYEHALFAALARGLGFGLNSEPLERVALSVPMQVYGKHSDSPLSLRAILLGQAGLIPTDAPQLHAEYDFMRAKFSLTPLSDLNWQFSGVRPPNFPSRRLLLLASALEGGFNRMARLIDADTAEDMASALLPEGHRLSPASVNNLIVNVAVPALFCYALECGNDYLMQKAVEILQSLPPENNRITRLFAESGLSAHNAYESQALVQLRKCFCETRRCLLCRIGHRMLKKNE